MLARVLVVSDHPLSIEGLLQLLREQKELLEIVGVLGYSVAALEQAVSLRPDVVLLDCDSAGESVAEWMAALRSYSLVAQVEINLCVIVYNAPDDVGTAGKCLADGVSGYVLKRDQGKQILEALRVAMEGNQWLSPSLGARAVQLVKEAEPRSSLKAREWMVLELLAEGLGNKEIATRLSLAESTVRHSVSDLYGILGASNRVELALMARELLEKFP